MYDQLRNALMGWYRVNGRNLPWRQTRDPYKIWLSEVILQQTRVQQGLPYYERFVDKYPTVVHLAHAEEEEILGLWKGLGYYTRARNLQKTAREIVRGHGGAFPDNYQALVMLKGIGPYTGSAIAAFAFGEAKAVLDGNVLRVISRVLNLGEDIAKASTRVHFQQIATEWLGTADPGVFNQAIMDFGALVCSPKPICPQCPLAEHCAALREGTVKQRPQKAKRPAKRNRYLHYFYHVENECITMWKRDTGDIWAQMFDLPLIEKMDASPPSSLDLGHMGITSPTMPAYRAKHQLTHQTIHANFYLVPKLTYRPGYTSIEIAKLDSVPYSQLLATFFDYLFSKD
ncbi:MAG: A/G-specific adenine glycosylase [Bacteroidetes bacterium]|nr:A/G-specific adenine glycosylase [Bacteroidota bacterium]